MKFALLLVALGFLNAAEEQFTFIGTIDKLTPTELSVKTQRGSFPIAAGAATEVVKDKPYQDFTPLKIGNEISVRCQPDASGKLVATKVWANPVSFAATVKDVRADQIEVVVNGGDERRVVLLYPDTVFGANRSDIKAGKQIRIAGLDVGNGVVDAARIAVYNTDLPTKK